MIFLHGLGVAVTKHTNKWISDLVVKKKMKKHKISVLASLENPKFEKKSKSKKIFFARKKIFFCLKIIFKCFFLLF